MTPQLKNILIIVGISVLLSGGILMIIIPCILVSNWYPLLSIFVFATSFIFPIMTNTCTTSSSDDSGYLYDDPSQHELGAMVAWLTVGILITIGYSIPFELFRVSSMPLVEMLLTMGGGTIILASILLFQFVVVKRGASADEY